MGVKFWTSWGSPKKFSKSHCYGDFFKNGVGGGTWGSWLKKKKTGKKLAKSNQPEKKTGKIKKKKLAMLNKPKKNGKTKKKWQKNGK